MDVKVSHDDVTREIKKKVKNGHDIGRTGGVRKDVYGDFVYDGCYGEELDEVVFMEGELGGKVDVGDEAVNEGDESSTTHRTRTFLKDGGVVGERVDGQIDVWVLVW